MTATLTIAHLTDVHLGPITGFTPQHWNLKRATGYINWRRNRRDVYLRSVLDTLVADLKQQRPDHIAVTGDLINIGLPGEMATALAWLQTLGPPEAVTVIPGNHDLYTSIGRDIGIARWGAFMQSNGAGQEFVDAREAAFPFVRIVGRIAIVGLNSALPRPPMIASGELGAAQLARLETILGRLHHATLFRLVLIHHPPLVGQATRHHDLTDAAALETVLHRNGAELVLHGHNHRNMLARRSSATGAFPIVGAPSAALGRSFKSEPLARYNLYHIDGRSIEMIGRGLAEPGGPVVELERRMLAPVAADAKA